MLRKLSITALCGFILWRHAAAQNPVIIRYINSYKFIAIKEMQRTGIPASITLAQGILETQAGCSDLVKSSNNHFGIKCKNTWLGDKVYHDDDEKGECFRAYSNAEDSYRDHSDFLKNSPRYAFPTCNIILSFSSLLLKNDCALSASDALNSMVYSLPLSFNPLARHKAL